MTFGYDRHQPILKGVSFRIEPGERIGIVGKSGSGKTTIINLLARFYDVDEGRMLIDGLDIRQIDTGDLRRQIGVVLQEPFLFRGTIYDNLTYGLRQATPHGVIAAAKAANCHDFIARHALGYDTYVGERGSGLSGGERQRISIARALLYDPRILVLDEATSSGGHRKRKTHPGMLKRITEGRTTIAIAHRLSTLKNSDRIFLVDAGKIAEMGTHEELMAAKGIYHNLVKIQTDCPRKRASNCPAAAYRRRHKKVLSTTTKVCFLYDAQNEYPHRIVPLASLRGRTSPDGTKEGSRGRSESSSKPPDPTPAIPAGEKPRTRVPGPDRRRNRQTSHAKLQASLEWKPNNKRPRSSPTPCPTRPSRACSRPRRPGFTWEPRRPARDRQGGTHLRRRVRGLPLSRAAPRTVHLAPPPDIQGRGRRGRHH